MTERQGGELIDIEGNPQGQEDEDDELYSAESDQDGTAGNSKDQPGCSYAQPSEDVWNGARDLVMHKSKFQFSTSDSDDSDSSFDSSSDDFSQSNEEEDGAEKYRNEDDLDVYMSSEVSSWKIFLMTVQRRLNIGVVCAHLWITGSSSTHWYNRAEIMMS